MNHFARATSLPVLLLLLGCGETTASTAADAGGGAMGPSALPEVTAAPDAIADADPMAPAADQGSSGQGGHHLPPPEGGTGGQPTGGTGGSEPSGPFTCEGITNPAGLGVACRFSDECGHGQLCAGPSQDTFTCRQLCIPGRCEMVCALGQYCQPLNGLDGMPRLLEDGSPSGVCLEGDPPPARAEVYQRCGGPNSCVAGLDCLTLADPAVSFCSKVCEVEGEMCPSGGVCVRGADATQPDLSYCFLPCGEGEVCADPLTCHETILGSVCLPLDMPR